MNIPFLYGHNGEETPFPHSQSSEEGRPSQLLLCDHSLHGYTVNAFATAQDQPKILPSKRTPRPPNSFMIFLEYLRASYTGTGEKPTTRRAGQLWKDLTPEEKDYYKRRAIEAKQEHARRYPTYTLQPKKGHERRPYGSRKRSVQQVRGLEDSPSIAGSLEAIESFSSPGGPQSNQVSQPSWERMEPTTTFDASYSSNLGITSSSSSPQDNNVLGLYHAPYPLSQPSPLAGSTSFPTESPSTSVNLPLPFIQLPGVDNSPSISPYISSAYFSTQASPVQSASLTPYTYSPHMNQQSFEFSMESSSSSSPFLPYFEHLNLNDEFVNYASTSTLPPAPILSSVALPEIRMDDTQVSLFPGVPNLTQASTVTSASIHLDGSLVASYDDSAITRFTGWFPDPEGGT